MSEQDDELELEALKRQLDDAYATTRPRAGFEDELWVRMQARRSFAQKLADAWNALWTGIREVPAVPAAAVAVILVAVIGAGLITLSGGLPHGGGAANQETATSLDRSAGPFGRIPVPSLAVSAGHSASLPAQTGGSATAAGPEASNNDYAPSATIPNLYVGPARLSWSGALTVSSTTAPVYRYTEPGASQDLLFAQSLGASSQGSGQTTKTFTGADFTVTMRGSTASPTSPATFTLIPSGGGQNGGDPVVTAAEFVSAHALAPTWTFTVAVDALISNIEVRYVRQFDGGSLGQAAYVDWSGDPSGIEFDMNSGRVDRVVGPIPVSLDSADYPIISADTAIRNALATSSSSPNAPAVTLTRADMVYALAVVPGQGGYYEPCVLFSGTFQMNGTTYTKRILIPAVANS